MYMYYHYDWFIVITGLEFAFTECEIEPFTTMSVPIVLRPSKTAKYMSNIFYQYALINAGSQINKNNKDIVHINFLLTRWSLS